MKLLKVLVTTCKCKDCVMSVEKQVKVSVVYNDAMVSLVKKMNLQRDSKSDMSMQVLLHAKKLIKETESGHSSRMEPVYLEKKLCDEELKK